MAVSNGQSMAAATSCGIPARLSSPTYLFPKSSKTLKNWAVGRSWAHPLSFIGGRKQSFFVVQLFSQRVRPCFWRRGQDACVLVSSGGGFESIRVARKGGGGRETRRSPRQSGFWIGTWRPSLIGRPICPESRAHVRRQAILLPNRQTGLTSGPVVTVGGGIRPGALVRNYPA
jgi:hypothetical protein